MMRAFVPAFVAASVFGAAAVLHSEVEAGDNWDRFDEGGGDDGIIIHRFWAQPSLSIEFALNQDGAVNNNAVNVGTDDIPQDQLQDEIDLAFGEWEAVATANVIFADVAVTATEDVGCDLENIATWSDTSGLFDDYGQTTTTEYLGTEPLELDGTNTVPCGEGVNVILPAAEFGVMIGGAGVPMLLPGTIYDADIAANSVSYDFVLQPNDTADVVGVRALVTHEIGHALGISHTSLIGDGFGAGDPVGSELPTMFPTLDVSNEISQTQHETLSADDSRALAANYPGVGATSGISGRVMNHGVQVECTPATQLVADEWVEGARVWLYNLSDTSQPMSEAFTDTVFGPDGCEDAGRYSFDAVPPGDYFVCIMPWLNGVPNGCYLSGPDEVCYDDPDDDLYNTTVLNGHLHTGWMTECYSDHATGGIAEPNFEEEDLIQTVSVSPGETTVKIDFITGPQDSDFAMVFDISGSMNLLSGAGGETKIEALRDAAAAFVNFLDLTGSHRIGLTVFSDSAGGSNPPIDMQPLNNLSAADANTAIVNLVAGGRTNIVDGVQQGVDQLTGLASPNARQALLLFTDGRHNTPPGSDLNDITDLLVANDVILHSIGFGTDLSDAVLAEAASLTGGTHREEPSLDPNQLSKHFLSVAASAADDTMLIDPSRRLEPGQVNEVRFVVDASDRRLDLASLWTGAGEKRVLTQVTTPNGCKFLLDGSADDIDIRNGENHTVARIALPLHCADELEHEGVWFIEAINISDMVLESDIVVFGKSELRLVTSVVELDRLPVIVGRVLDGVDLVGEVSMSAIVRPPAAEKFDSEEADLLGSENQEHEFPRPNVSDVLEFDLNDEGHFGDARPGDSRYSSAVKVDRAGVYNARIIARLEDGRQREALISFFVGEEGFVAPTLPVRVRRDSY